MFPKYLGTALEENFRAAMEQEEIRSFEIPGQYTNAWYRMRAFPSAEGITVLGTDITEHKRMEREIESQAKFPAENPNPVLRIQRDGAIAFANAASGNLLRLWDRKVGERLPEPMDRLILQTLESGTTVEHEVDCGGQLYSLFFTPIVDSGYVNIYGRDITDRKQVEEHLRELSQRLTYHVDNSPLAVIEWGPDMRLIRWSAAAEQMFGWKAEEVLGKRIEDFRWVYEEDTQRVKEVSTDLKTGTNPHRFSANRNYRKDGSVVYSEWYNSSLLDESGNLRSILSLVLDVTERTRAEQELAESEERYRHLVQYAPAGIYEIDIKTMRFLEVNDVMCQMLGYSREELLSMPPDELLDEEGKRRFRERMVQALAGERISEQTEYKVKARDCHEIWGILNININYEDGQASSISVIAHDITERKQTEEKLRVSEERFRNMANTVPAIVWTAAPDGTILFTNEFCHIYTGSPLEETGSKWTDFLHPDDFVRGVEAWKGATENGTDYLLETRIRRHDGQYRWFQARALPVCDSLGNVTAWYGVSMDIHDRIEAMHALRDSQQQLQFLNESLEQKVREQTAEMRQLTAMLTKAEQRERHRIAHILHDDLQQRLYAVKMDLAFLLDEFIGGQPDLGAELVRTDKQIGDILTLTRNLTIELSPPILHDEGLTQALIWLAAQMHEKQGLRVEVQAEESFAIQEEAVQVLLFNSVRELLFNIVKHAEVDRAFVSLQRSGGDLRIEVWDEGKGFDVASLLGYNKSKIDEDESMKPGFGLPTLRHQLGLLGGHMDIQSEPDTGTRIAITMPYS
jgi:PAS domain S-box-containing protein